MSKSITELADSIAKLEKQLSEELDRQQDRFRYSFEGRRVRFEQEVEEAHARLKQAVIPWLFSSRLRHVISAPFIYAMIVPIAFFDLTITLYSTSVSGCTAFGGSSAASMSCWTGTSWPT